MNIKLLGRIARGTTTVSDASALRNQMLILARHIADAAAFFDSTRSTLPERDKAEASRHVDCLHAAAQRLAGERQHEIYSPEV